MSTLHHFVLIIVMLASSSVKNMFNATPKVNINSDIVEGSEFQEVCCRPLVDRSSHVLSPLVSIVVYFFLVVQLIEVNKLRFRY